MKRTLSIRTFSIRTLSIRILSILLTTLILLGSWFVVGRQGALANSLVSATGAETAIANEIPPSAPLPDKESGKDKARGIIASYHGERLNLARGWQDAQICAEFAANEVRCFSDGAELAAVEPTAQVGTQSVYSCPYGWACLWEHVDYQGRRLQWRTKGVKNLADWGFRDQASSAYNNRRLYGFVLRDFRTRLPDPRIILPVGATKSNLKNVKYLYGGDWNDKVDAVELK